MTGKTFLTLAHRGAILVYIAFLHSFRSSSC